MRRCRFLCWVALPLLLGSCAKLSGVVKKNNLADKGAQAAASEAKSETPTAAEATETASATTEDYSSDIAKLGMPDDTNPGWTGPLFLVTGTKPGLSNLGAGQLSATQNMKSWKILTKTKKSVKHTYRAATAGNGRIVVVHEVGARWSRDGKTWQDASDWPRYDSGQLRGKMVDIAFGDGLFVAVGSGNNIIASRDGDTWAVYKGQLDPSDSYVMRCAQIKFIDGKFYLSCNSDRVMVMSVQDNDLVWEGLKNYQASTHIPHVGKDDEGNWVVVTSNNAWAGTDPLNCEEIDGKSPFNPTDVVYIGKRFVVPASHGNIYWSKDKGKNWKKMPVAGGSTWMTAVKIGNAAYLGANSSGTIVKTADGRKFKPIGMGSANMKYIYDLEYVP